MSSETFQEKLDALNGAIADAQARLDALSIPEGGDALRDMAAGVLGKLQHMNDMLEAARDTHGDSDGQSGAARDTHNDSEGQ